jgi:hypothetical protein
MHNSLLLTQPPTSPKSISPICVRVLVRVVRSDGTVEKAYFVYLILPTEHLIELVQDIFEREFVRELVDHYRYHVSEVQIDGRCPSTGGPPHRLEPAPVSPPPDGTGTGETEN